MARMVLCVDDIVLLAEIMFEKRIEGESRLPYCFSIHSIHTITITITTHITNFHLQKTTSTMVLWYYEYYMYGTMVLWYYEKRKMIQYGTVGLDTRHECSLQPVRL